MLNKCSFIGNLTKDIDVKVLPDDTHIGNFRIAVNTKVGKNTDVLYLDCVMFGDRNKSISEFLVKGKQVYVDGRLKVTTREFQETTYTNISLIINDLYLLGR